MKAKSKIVVMRNPKEHCMLMSKDDLAEIRDAISAAMDDIGDYVRIHDYNNGILLGNYVGKPIVPMMPHQVGIDASKVCIERCRKSVVKLYRLTGMLPPVSS